MGAAGLEDSKGDSYTKNPGGGLTVDNIRPISLTSNMVKLVERVLHSRVSIWMADNLVIKPNQIGFRSDFSIWCAHADLESRIQLARKRRQYAALVTLDIAKAYDSVEHFILLNTLERLNFPQYFIEWVAEFLKSREFYCVKDGCSSSRFKQTRGVPQGAVLSPILFNALMSTIPTDQEVTVYIYADDIALFAADCGIYSLQLKLQRYINMLEIWLQSISLSLNVNKSALMAFPLAEPISISILYKQEPIQQVDSIKYLGIIYNDKLNWSPHIEYITTKAQRAPGLLHKLSNRKYGLRRHTLITLYKMYMRPIMEFGCILFSGGPAYKTKPLVLLEREALRMCLGLPRFVAINVLYQEARLPTLLVDFEF
uniref:Putative tick transposon n=1 Tax=Rhipicephalus microplus TaxID=6941 RepID=A0A6G5AC88_RHIMP